MHFGSQGISQHLPPLHWPAEACDQWNQGIYLASSFHSESNNKSDTVAILQKGDSFWNGSILEFAISSFQVHFWAFPANSGAFFMLGENTPFGHWERNLCRCPDILRPYNMEIFPKTSCLANKPIFISTPAQVPVGHPAAVKTMKWFLQWYLPKSYREYPTSLQKSIPISGPRVWSAVLLAPSDHTCLAFRKVNECQPDIIRIDWCKPRHWWYRSARPHRWALLVIPNLEKMANAVDYAVAQKGRFEAPRKHRNKIQKLPRTQKTCVFAHRHPLKFLALLCRKIWRLVFRKFCTTKSLQDTILPQDSMHLEIHWWCYFYLNLCISTKFVVNFVVLQSLHRNQ